MQARVVSDPIKNPLIGWWSEWFLFYVKHRDMPDSSHFQNMVLNVGYDMTPTVAAAKTEHYHSGGTVDWVDQCLRAVVPHYFRDDGESYSVAMLGNLPAAKISQQSWMDSVLLDSQYPQGSAIPAGSTPNATDILMQQWELMRAHKLTTATYEEFLQSYGVRPTETAAPNKPELIRYVRDWNYPANTVNPADGSAASAMSWAIAERVDKDRFFKEPGFIFGVTVARPKVYIGKQVGNAAQMLTGAFEWLPAVMADDPQTSLKKYAASAGPLAGFQGAGTDPYWVDVRDLFLYGDQFTNFGVAATDAGLVALPTATLQKKYPASADADALFKAASPANQVRCDGVLNLQIAGHQRDHT